MIQIHIMNKQYDNKLYLSEDNFFWEIAYCIPKESDIQKIFPNFSIKLKKVLDKP